MLGCRKFGLLNSERCGVYFPHPMVTLLYGCTCLSGPHGTGRFPEDSALYHPGLRKHLARLRKFWDRATKVTLVQKITTYWKIAVYICLYIYIVSLNGKNKVFVWETLWLVKGWTIYIDRYWNMYTSSWTSSKHQNQWPLVVLKAGRDVQDWGILASLSTETGPVDVESNTAVNLVAMMKLLGGKLGNLKWSESIPAMIARLSGDR